MNAQVHQLARVKAGVTLPHDAAAERLVLGSCLLGVPDIWQIVADTLTARDFYEPRHQTIYSALSILAEQGRAMDSVSLHDQLVASASLERVGGDEYLLTLTDALPFPGHVERHCARVRELSTVRRVYETVMQVANEALEPIEDVGDFLDRAEVALVQATERRRHSNEPTHIGEAFTELVEALTKQAEEGGFAGHRTGLHKLDEYTEGLPPSDLVVIAGRPGTGKTSLGMGMAIGVARSSRLPVLFFSLEMPRIQLLRRVASAHASIDQTKLRRAQLNQDEWDAITRADEDLSRLGVWIDDSSMLSILDVRRTARRYKRKHGGLGAVFIDYLQLLRPLQNRRKREEEVAEASRLAKALAKELNCPVVALAQLNRDAEKRSDRRPQLADLRESGAIEQDADTILFIYRDELYNAATEDAGIAEIIIGKQRNGVTGVVPLAFKKECTRFGNLFDHEEREWKRRQEQAAKQPRRRRSDDHG